MNKKGIFGVIPRLFVLLAPLVLLSACAGSQIEDEEIIGSVESLYNEGMDLMEQKSFLEAINTFEELQRQHPYSGWATRSEMMVAYAHFRQGDFDETVANADRFLNTHPGHKETAYILYLRGLAFYNRMKDVKRDQGNTREALRTFEELRERYPNSVYAKDARLKISLCKDHLAGREMVVGRFYQGQGRYLPAINRFRTVVERYQTTSQVQEALYRLTESYLTLGVEDEAQAAAAVLGHNYPASGWYKDAYALLKTKNLEPKENKRSWLASIWKGVKSSVKGE